MNDIYILICIISLFAGVSSISISYFIYNSRATNPSLKYYIGLITSLFAIECSISLIYYIKNTHSTNTSLIVIYKLLDLLGTSFSSLLGLLFIYSLFELKVSNIKKKLFIIISVFQFICGSIYYLFQTNSFYKYILHLSIIAVIIYEIYLISINYKHITNKNLKQGIFFFLLITIVFLPLIVLESFKPCIEIIKNIELLKIMALPCYFLTINIFNIVFVFKYFNAPLYLNDDKLTDYFKKKYDITEKQSDIIELILKGHTYKQIAEELFISPKTVDNHIQNIYKKLHVSSKIQLSNFIRSNA